MSANGDLQEPLFERLGATPDPEDSLPKQNLPTKRKRGQNEEEQLPKKAAKRAKSKKPKNIDEDDLDTEAGVNKMFSRMDNQLLADYMAQQTRKHESDLSAIELEDKYLSASAIRDTTSWDKPRTIENLPAFLERFSTNPTKLWQASKKNGAPHTIIVTGAGIRAAELARTIRKFSTIDATVAKLFAKHIKLADSIKFLKSTRTGIAVGTPIRLKELMDDGALITDRLERIIIDASYIDQKRRGVLEIKETQVPLMVWLGQAEFRERYGATSDCIQLLFY